jgi:haloacetate dehalogenase
LTTEEDPMHDPAIAGFDRYLVPAGEQEVAVSLGGTGPPVLLLHGFPETHLAWRRVAPLLADRFTVVCADLPGYGDSPAPGAGHTAYAKRVTADAMIRLMQQIGWDRFTFVGHDRGALVGFRAALDHPEAIDHLAVLDVLPTTDMWASLRGTGGVFAFHLYLLAQLNDLPERMLCAAPRDFFGHFLDTWTTVPGAIPDDIREAYLATSSRPEVIRAICNDYRASAFIDAADDDTDRLARRQLEMPVLALWQDPGGQTLPFDPEEVWASWATDLRTRALPCGHFLPEECPAEVAAAVADLVGTPA